MGAGQINWKKPRETRFSGSFREIGCIGMHTLFSRVPHQNARASGTTNQISIHPAAYKMAHEAPGQTLQPTALVHEAWLRLGGGEGTGFPNRACFFAAAGEAMRRILVEAARRKKRLKHGGNLKRMDIEDVDLVAPLVAEKERDMISQRTKDGLAAARRRGTKLGNPRAAKAVKSAVRANINRADAYVEGLLPVIGEIKAAQPFRPP